MKRYGSPILRSQRLTQILNKAQKGHSSPILAGSVWVPYPTLPYHIIIIIKKTKSREKNNVDQTLCFLSPFT
jgi:hypothetical protein